MAVAGSLLSPTSSQLISGMAGMAGMSFHNKLRLCTLVHSPSKGFHGDGDRRGGEEAKTKLFFLAKKHPFDTTLGIGGKK